MSMRILLPLALLTFQQVRAQRILTAAEAAAIAGPGPVHVTALHADSLCSSYLIRVDTEVPLHMHRAHTEHVMVLEGEGLMTLGDTVRSIRVGDIVIIPRNTPHAVKVHGHLPLRVISVQAPRFDGADRVLLTKSNR